MGTRLRRLVQFFLVTAFIIIGIVGFNALKASKQQIQKRKTAPPVPVVRVMKVTTGEHLVQVIGGRSGLIRSQFDAVGNDDRLAGRDSGVTLRELGDGIADANNSIGAARGDSFRHRAPLGRVGDTHAKHQRRSRRLG